MRTRRGISWKWKLESNKTIYLRLRCARVFIHSSIHFISAVVVDGFAVHKQRNGKSSAEMAKLRAQPMRQSLMPLIIIGIRLVLHYTQLSVWRVDSQRPTIFFSSSLHSVHRSLNACRQEICSRISSTGDYESYCVVVWPLCLRVHSMNIWPRRPSHGGCKLSIRSTVT